MMAPREAPESFPAPSTIVRADSETSITPSPGPPPPPPIPIKRIAHDYPTITRRGGRVVMRDRAPDSQWRRGAEAVRVFRSPVHFAKHIRPYLRAGSTRPGGDAPAVVALELVSHRIQSVADLAKPLGDRSHVAPCHRDRERFDGGIELVP